MIRVAVFDDHAHRREALCLLLEGVADMDCVGAFPDCREVVERVEACRPDVVLMDIDMPHVDGIRGVALLRERFADLHILMQTVFEDDDKILRAIRAGANGYLLKQTPPEKLVNGIREVVQGGAPMTPVIARRVLELFQGRDRTMRAGFNLTQRELEILALLVKGFSYKMIAAELGISYPTVNTHVGHIYQKLHVPSVAAAVSLAVKNRLV
jgi:DNA-binding NarL/FixJ family response regulator